MSSLSPPLSKGLLSLPRPFDDEFLADLPYSPEVLFLDQLIEIDAEKSMVRCRMPTNVQLPLTESQRVHPVRHPKHVAGAVMVHASGMLGFVHAYYLLGLRHHQGWVGYGTHLHKVVFRKLVPPGEPIIATCVATRMRRGKSRCFGRYTFEYHHEGDLCYEGEQSAIWIDTTAAGAGALDAAAEG